MITVAGCGGSGRGGTTASAEQTVRGNGFAFSAPADWSPAISPVGASVAPEKGSDTVVTVTVFRLVRPFRPAVWPRAAAELDHVADRLARKLGGSVDSRETLGTGVREYRLAYERKGTKLSQRIRFVLRGRREYELLCRWKAADSEPAACGQLLASFRLS